MSESNTDGDGGDEGNDKWRWMILRFLEKGLILRFVF
jgi:hypothetical protein|tara:strand:- start:198 stop:308 length:111 start_codon:yes stop_codon:yes gene_type:complete